MKNCEELWNVMKNCFLHVMKNCSQPTCLQCKTAQKICTNVLKIISGLLAKKIQQSSKHKLQIVEPDDLWGGWIIGKKNIWSE